MNREAGYGLEITGQYRLMGPKNISVSQLKNIFEEQMAWG